MVLSPLVVNNCFFKSERGMFVQKSGRTIEIMYDRVAVLGLLDVIIGEKR